MIDLPNFRCGAMLLAFSTQIQPVHSQFLYTNSGTSVIITGYSGPGGNISIPEVIAGLPVTGIANKAFYDNDTLVQVTIPHTVTSIGADSFYACNNLNSIAIPEGVSTIGDRAFFVCGQSFFYNGSAINIVAINLIHTIGLNENRELYNLPVNCTIYP